MLDSEFVRGETKIRKGKLYLSWRGLGDAFFDYDTTWVTGPLEIGRVNGILEELSSNPETSGLDAELFYEPFNVVHVKAPPGYGGRLPDDFFFVSREGRVSKTNHTRLTYWNNGPPGSVDNLDKKFIQELREKQEIEAELEALRQEIAGQLDSQAPATRAWNSLNSSFESGDTKPLGCGPTKRLIPGMIKSRELIARRMEAFKQKYPGSHLRHYREPVGSYVLELHLPTQNVIEYNRGLTGEELLSSKWLFLDIEIPFYRTTGEVSWVGLEFCQGSEIKKQIHTLRYPGEGVDGFEVFVYGTQEELIEGVARETNEEDPLVVAPYNAQFDLIKLREAGKFDVGSRDTDPKVAAFASIAKRISIYSRQVLDLYPLFGSILSGFLPSQKLESVAKHLLGEKEFSKSITYEEIEELEMDAISGSAESARKIASYLASDVDVLRRMVFDTQEGRDTIEDIAAISNAFGLELSRVAHSPSSVNGANERKYFKDAHTFRDAVYRRSKRRERTEASARKAFRDMLMGDFPTARAGLYRNVHKVFVPAADFFWDFGMNGEDAMPEDRRDLFPGAKEFFKYKYQFLENPQRQLSLSQFANALASWMFRSYGECLIEQGIIKDIMPMEDFMPLFGDFCASLAVSEWALLNLKNGRLSEEKVRKHMPDSVRSYLMENSISEKRFASLVNRMGQDRLGKAERRLRYVHGVEAYEVDKVFTEKKAKVNRFIQDNGFTVVGSKGTYLYLAGGSNEAFRNAPVIHADEIPVLLSADRVYYNRHGFLEGIRNNGKPHNYMTVFEQEHFSRYLEGLFNGRYADALLSILEAVERLDSGSIPNDDMVFHSKSSGIFWGHEGSERTYFQTHGKPEATEPATGRGYVTRKYNGKERRFYIMDADMLDLDMGFYTKRFKDRAWDMLYPVIGGNCAAKLLEGRLSRLQLQEVGSVITFSMLAA